MTRRRRPEDAPQDYLDFVALGPLVDLMREHGTDDACRLRQLLGEKMVQGLAPPHVRKATLRKFPYMLGKAREFLEEEAKRANEKTSDGAST